MPLPPPLHHLIRRNFLPDPGPMQYSRIPPVTPANRAGSTGRWAHVVVAVSVGLALLVMTSGMARAGSNSRIGGGGGGGGPPWAWFAPFTESATYDHMTCGAVCGKEVVLSEQTDSTSGNVSTAASSSAAVLQSGSELVETQMNDFIGNAPATGNYVVSFNWTLAWQALDENICDGSQGLGATTTDIYIFGNVYDSTSQSWLHNGDVSTTILAAEPFCPIYFLNPSGLATYSANFGAYFTTSDQYELYSYVEVYTTATAVGASYVYAEADVSYGTGYNSHLDWFSIY